LAKQSGGVFYLRIEDTDEKREVKGAETDIIKAFEQFGIEFDESIVKGGAYGPYRQSDRRESTAPMRKSWSPRESLSLLLHPKRA
jgi:glutamyl-tRNA synthetase